MQENETHEEFAVITSTRDRWVPCLFVRDALGIEHNDDHGINDEHADGNGIAYKLQPPVKGALENAHVGERDADLAERQRMDAEDLRKQ